MANWLTILQPEANRRRSRTRVPKWHQHALRPDTHSFAQAQCIFALIFNWKLNRKMWSVVRAGLSRDRLSPDDEEEEATKHRKIKFRRRKRNINWFDSLCVTLCRPIFQWKFNEVQHERRTRQRCRTARTIEIYREQCARLLQPLFLNL